MSDLHAETHDKPADPVVKKLERWRKAVDERGRSAYRWGTFTLVARAAMPQLLEAVEEAYELACMYDYYEVRDAIHDALGGDR